MAQPTVRAATQSLRSVHSSAVRAAAAVDVDVVVLPPMFDIFDAPARLRRTGPNAAPAEQPVRAARPQSSLSSRALNPKISDLTPASALVRWPGWAETRCAAAS
ncbi:hypothetical protein MSAN_00427700 [Mycena sanguinolenta]|uniref:Uncharacterized protein n=1 Tax=Mycena sanguinolenta TaxID=230812 RepID=A0A8H7DLB3_9AGAR|nr:hypothetical protein MSAN_00427700 [Mycena sanguinolenta]